MAKRRNLKRDIGYVAGELFTEVLVAKMLVPGIDQDQSDELLARILEMQDQFVQRAAKPDAKENKKLVKQYYKKLEEDLQKEIQAIVGGIETLSKGKEV
ncbi:hypothetical protein [Parabacteroides sp. PF5-6]|uniref:hypothetical protein n=1 Tax=Parabacteroides sp. PF5-6 TaxID=1742403 RepID=UPI00240601A1|nr:hypothetical protein [Parabacteroides sp. PF5-6]MDF9830144.1 uncharacterized membrane protein YheB (UPF0754 family) [Parabacteroides sp. PF5-6]